MTDKKKILLLHRKYPVSISGYFLTAFRHRDDVEIVDVSPYYGCFIPWKGGMYLPDKYRAVPDFVIPFDFPEVPWPIVDNLTGHQEWDMILNIDAGIRWSARPKKNCPVVHVATDPHVLNYDKPRGYSDYFFNMQKVYSQPGDIYLPYAYSKYHFYPPHDSVLYEWDASLVGLQYDKRLQWVTSLRNSGYKVFFDTGPIYDEYRDITWKSKVVLSWSSEKDLICRVFEAMAMKRPLVTNVVPDILDFFVDKEHCVMFDGEHSRSVELATDAVIGLLNDHSAASRMVDSAHELVSKRHTFDNRVEQIMCEVFGG